ncbi:MBL fold metallo-hydrolase [Streptomyces sp. 4N509B]|uniref:MBL fold metallo-hydrolase n=1 Tax=Streptomyces sp. 4N509B TaxID=3457413 RepID=UPI003FD58899
MTSTEWGEPEEVAAGVWRWRLPGWDETVGLVAGDDGLLLVDTGPGPEAVAAPARWAAGRSRRSASVARWAAVTHPHFDHVLGATGLGPEVELYGAAGLRSRLVAAELAADAVGNGMDASLAGRHAAGIDAVAGRFLEVSGRREIALGADRRAVLANMGPGHTPCDLAVLVPASSAGGPPVVFCGDLVEESGEPQAGEDASPSRWPAALDRLLALGGEDARYVPGHGAVVDAAFVRAQRAALARRFGVTR